MNLKVELINSFVNILVYSFPLIIASKLIVGYYSIGALFSIVIFYMLGPKYLIRIVEEKKNPR
jgi:hypothetical protein